MLCRVCLRSPVELTNCRLPSVGRLLNTPKSNRPSPEIAYSIGPGTGPILAPTFRTERAFISSEKSEQERFLPHKSDHDSLEDWSDYLFGTAEEGDSKSVPAARHEVSCKVPPHRVATLSLPKFVRVRWMVRRIGRKVARPIAQTAGRQLLLLES